MPDLPEDPAPSPGQVFAPTTATDPPLPDRETLERKKLALEIASLGDKRSHVLTTVIPLLSVLVSVIALGISSVQQGRQAAETARDHRDEHFQEAVQTLGHEVPAERLSAVITLNDLAQSSPDRKQEASIVLAERLNVEPDDGVAEFIVSVISKMGKDALTHLVKVNRRDQVVVAGLCGRYVGLTISARSKYLHSNAAEEAAEARAIDLLQDHLRTQNLPFVQDSRSFRLFFDLRSLIRGHSGVIGKDVGYLAARDAAKAKDCINCTAEATEVSIRDNIRYLWLNSEAIAATMRNLNGQLAGFDLGQTALLLPKLRNLDMRGADLRAAMWEAPTLYGSDFSYADLTLASMPLADLRSVQLYAANLTLTNFGSPGNAPESLYRASQAEVKDCARAANWWELDSHSFLYHELLQKCGGSMPALKEQRQAALQQGEAKAYLKSIAANNEDRIR